MHNIRSIIYIILKTILINTVFILLVLLSLLPLSFLYIWKSIITQWTRYFHTDLSPMKFIDYVTITSLDTDIDNLKSDSFNCNGGFYGKLKGKVSGQQIFHAFVKTVIKIDCSKEIPRNHKHIRFHQSIYKLRGYWFYKTFPNELKYEDHVTSTILDDGVSYEEEICKWWKVRYDIKKCPLRGILLIYRKQTDDTMFAFKIHHVLADGMSVAYILDLMTNTPSNNFVAQDFHLPRWKSILILIKAAFQCFEYIIKTILTVAESPINRLREKDEIFLTQVSFSVAAVKNIRHKNKVRFQAVVLDIILNYINSLFQEKFEREHISDKICIWTTLPWPNHPQNKLCNHYTTAPLVFTLQSGNIPRQESIAESNQKFQDFHNNFFNRVIYHLMKPISLLPINIISFCHKIISSKVTVQYGHLIGPKGYSKLLGIECYDIYGYLIPSQQKFITFTYSTMGNVIKLAIIGPKSLISSQDHADQFSKDNIRNHIAKSIVTANVIN